LENIGLKRNRTRTAGFTLVEVMLAAFLMALAAALAAATVPIAHIERQRAELTMKAAGLAQKEIETIRVGGYAEASAAQLYAVGLIDSTTPVSGTTSTYTFNTVDASVPDNAPTILPSGNATITITEATIGLRQIVITVTWYDGSLHETQSYTAGTVICNA
jgi:type II secretory pathway pseudopilin PulG